jgi:hypothetical protein
LSVATKCHVGLHREKQPKSEFAHPYDKAWDAQEHVLQEEILHGMTARRWLEYLAAIGLGNAIYFLSLSPHLPSTLRHDIYHIDWGLGLDFLICAAIYGLIRLGSWLGLLT